MVEPIETLNDVVELLQKNGYNVDSIDNFTACCPERFSVELEITNLELE